MPHWLESTEEHVTVANERTNGSIVNWVLSSLVIVSYLELSSPAARFIELSSPAARFIHVAPPLAVLGSA
jgi:hypothetical protein